MKFLFLCFILFIGTVWAGEGTYPLAHIVGPQIIENSTHIPTGYYTFRHVETGQYLQFIDFDNQVVPTQGPNSTVFNGTLWTVKWHGDKNYSIHHLNKVKYDKCISTRWDHYRGMDDAAVMWQCEIDNVTRNEPDFDIYPHFKGVYNASSPRPLQKRWMKRYVNTYEAIRLDKQQWLFMRADPSTTPEFTNVQFDPSTGENRMSGSMVEPDRDKWQHSGSHYFYIVSAAHLWNMIPRCIYPTAMYVFDFTANNTGVTKLDYCVWGNRSLLWEATLWKPASFPLGYIPDSRFLPDNTSSFAWIGLDPQSATSSTLIWWAVLLTFSLIVWVLH
ncbi:uncharacterized protein BYT42DRAFT_573566 [Radiomyces spectabilis]|uniref:uncharacterized protein n=1 Tax=Radiomyces spectabilis TaxID=64574 RepID=UPI00221FA7E9|nr:uncharacterized protein BYT42DRAFT_573566 [Radiomyces spectabilis]KAI8376141.1 hypothetical protein BYT42DRAFT_573566 [Radiomyces spectabilis]